MGKVVCVTCLLFLIFPVLCFPEGTKQIAPFANANGNLCIDKSRNEFGFFDAAPEFRINICIADPAEQICLGLGRVSNPDYFVDVRYQVKDPAGNIILGPLPIPRSGQGFITGYSAAIAGPFISAGGYDPVRVYPTITGNYSLEFYYDAAWGGQYTEDRRIEFDHFDISVLNAAGQPVDGRVWSKAWQFNCGHVEEPPTENRFFGIMYIYSDDSIVTSLNCNGFVGGTFSISSNKTGCSKTGDITVDRQSRTGFHTYPQYKVFLAEPDSLVFPTGKAMSGLVLPIGITNECATGSVDFGITVQQDGVIEIMIKVDPPPGAGPRDVKLTASVLANPGGSGINTIRWNGLDGQGNPVAHGSALTATVRYVHGITHIPIYDIEYNDNGYVVDIVRPYGPRPDIYWDDSLLPYGSSVNLIGCNDPQGCHIWDMMTGDTTTINSWWYVASSTAPSVDFILKRAPGAPGSILGKTSFCLGGITRDYTAGHSSDATAYHWSYSGTGAAITVHDTLATITFDSLATSGNLTVSGYNAECGEGTAASLPLNFYPLPAVTLAEFDTVCINEPPFSLYGGAPSGGIYQSGGTTLATFDPPSAGPGLHEVIYIYTDSHGCSNSDTAMVPVAGGRDCEIHIWVPTAFSPNDDGLNDQFRAATRNVRQFSMSVFNRSGELVFSTDDPAKGWDGRFRGVMCPPDIYVYLITYQSSLSPPEDSTLKGYLTLVR